MRTTVLLSIFVLAGGGRAIAASSDTSATLKEAWRQVRSGAREAAQATGYAVKRTGDKTIRVARDTVKRVEREVTDTWITTEVKSKILTARDPNGDDLHVETTHGVVKLRGTVKSEDAAMAAVDEALKVDGVVAVDAEINYPTRPVTPKIYRK